MATAQKKIADKAKAVAREKLTDEYEQVTNPEDREDVSKLADDELVDLITSTVVENKAEQKRRPMLPYDFNSPLL